MFHKEYDAMSTESCSDLEIGQRKQKTINLFENPESTLGVADQDVRSYGSTHEGSSSGLGAVPVSKWASERSTPPPGTSYPPGFSESGDFPMSLSTQSLSPVSPTEAGKKKRRRKKKRVAPMELNANERTHDESPLSEEERELKQGEYAHSALTRPDYTQPLPRALPPIGAKTAAFAGTATALLGPVVPELDETKRPEYTKHDMSFTNGSSNPSFEGHTGFISGSDPNKIKQEQPINVNDASRDQIIRPKATLYFKDGVRYIDYVIAYEEDEDNPKNNEKREVFERGLVKKGLILETEPKEESQDQKTCFIKIHVPWDVCLKYAERMKMKMPLKEDRFDEPDEDDDEIDCSCITNAWNRVLRPFKLNSAEVLEKTEPDCYTAEFTKEKMEYFDIKDEKSFFSTSERSRIAYRIMSETRFGPKPIQVGIVQLIGDGAYNAAFPLHEGRHTNNEKKMATDDNMRRLLYWEWARWGRWYKFQPLDLIRRYLGDKIALYFAFVGFYTGMLWLASAFGLGAFIYGMVTLFLWETSSQYLGDKVALYFAWLGYYTEMLIYPTLVGLIVFIYSIATLWTYPPTQEVCDETYPTYAGNLTMCPVCDADCGYWQLGSTCLSAQVTHVFDNEATIFFAVFMSLWATMFLELWKRKQFRLAYDWDLVDYDEDRDLIRPEFEAQVTRERLNPITGQREPYLSAKDRYTRACLSITTVFFWVLVVIAAVFAVIVYRLVIAAVFASSVDLSSLGSLSSVATPSMLTTITASLLSLIIIMCLNFVYEKMALILTDMELPRTQIEFDDSFTFKMFCFQFVNFYSYLFYVAFFKQSFAGYPANYTYLFGEFRWDECDAGGCMYELSIQLIIIMLGKQIWNNVIELMMPWMINKYRQYKSTKVSDEQKDNEYTRWEQDYDLTAFRQMGLFYEYLEMVIQFGFVTLFVAAFPLAPVLALINNIIEIRLDANKFICELRRPLSQKCSDIGAWYYLLDFLGTLSVVTNAFTIAITSDAIPKMVYYYSYSVQTYGFNTLEGYTNNSLSYFNVKDFNERSIPTSNPLNVTVCRYRDYRSPPEANPPYALTMQYWHVIASRLAFVIVMEHVVFALKRLLDYLVPDRPLRLKQQIKREHFLVQQMLLAGDERNPQTPFSSSPTKTSSGKFFVENEKQMTPL